MLSAACGAADTTTSCTYTLDGAAVTSFPANVYPSAWTDTKQVFQITLVDRETSAVSELLVPDCKRDEARRIIADRRAEDRGQGTNGVPIADRTYQ